ncbi:MAG: TlyA family RNA methyltransferase [Caldilineaceae bacterium]|nr:TlyA family RNA methyltransferase [Caldilineaceae bacterium]
MRSSSSKQRLDQRLVALGLAENVDFAQRLIMAGQVLVDERVHDKPGVCVRPTATIRVRNQAQFVSRGGHKLEAALTAFQIDADGLVALDVGASTGGFTDCLLQRAAKRVFAVDVGYGQLAWKLRGDPRVVCLERTNIRHLHELPGGEVADLAVIDASFIGLDQLLPATLRLLTSTAQIVALIKPQFEADRPSVGEGGVVRDEAVHRRVLAEVWQLAEGLGMAVSGLMVSPLLGPAGNVEFLIWLKRDGASSLEQGQSVKEAIKGARQLRAGV